MVRLLMVVGTVIGLVSVAGAGRASAREAPTAAVTITTWVARADGTTAPLAGTHAVLGDADGQIVQDVTIPAEGGTRLEAAAGMYSLIVYARGYHPVGRMACDASGWNTDIPPARWAESDAVIENPLALDPDHEPCLSYLFQPLDPPVTASGAGAVYLTIDDGYLYLCQTVDLINRLGIHATFFLTGQAILANPDCVRRLVESGNRLGNHTFAHENLTRLSRDGIIRTLQRTEDAAVRVAGVSTKPLCRPPGGAVNAFVRQVASEWGCRMVLWDRDTRDWSGVPAGTVESTALSVRCTGEVVLLHTQAYPRDRVAIPNIVAALQARGCAVTMMR
jgi:peptidoglycan/xylan/chitin deacetylase (PgdA/CDA1 family)